MCIKILGIILILCGTTYLGFLQSFRLRMRIKRLKAFKETFIIISGHIDYACISIPEIFEDVANSSSYTYISQFYSYLAKTLRKREKANFRQVWNGAVELYIQEVFLNDSDSQIIKHIGQMPLYLDGQMQVRILGETIHELDKVIDEAETQINQKSRIYKCAGFVAGVFIVLVLI